MARHLDRTVATGSDIPEAELHHAIKQVCVEALDGWKDGLLGKAIEITQIAGGISNALFKVDPRSASPSDCGSQGSLQPVAVRLYGANTEQFIDRDKELAIMEVAAQHGFGPRVLATFANGRIEEFLQGRSLASTEMASPEFAPAVAALLRRFHAIPAPGQRQPRTPFARTREWLDIAEQFTFDDEQKKAAFLEFDFPAMRAEVEAVAKAAAAFQSPIVFSHNDLLAGNVMVPLSTEKQDGVEAGTSGERAAPQQGMTFIDFEYSDWAPRGFDWGNHFCEYAGFECDYTLYPKAEDAARFLEHYFAAGGDAPSQSQLAQHVAEANVYALAAHQFWGAWALLQAKWSSIDFDYLGYAKLRWAEYRRRKPEFLKGLHDVENSKTSARPIRIASG